MTLPLRRRTLTRGKVVEAALAIVEEEGLAALSMRRLGKRLGVEGMALYTHVRHKADLLDAVAERVLEELAFEPDPGAPWQERIRRGALAWGRLAERYPRAFPLVYRPGLRTESVALLTEELLDALRAAGLGRREAALAYQSLVVLLDGALAARCASSDERLRTAWRGVAERAEPARHPRTAELAPHAATLGWSEVYESGLDLLLGGLERRVASGDP